MCQTLGRDLEGKQCNLVLALVTSDGKLVMQSTQQAAVPVLPGEKHRRAGNVLK